MSNMTTFLEVSYGRKLLGLCKFDIIQSHGVKGKKDDC